MHSWQAATAGQQIAFGVALLVAAQADGVEWAQQVGSGLPNAASADSRLCYYQIGLCQFSVDKQF